VIPALLTVVQLVTPAAPAVAFPNCSEGDIRTLAFAMEMVRRGDDLMFLDAGERGASGSSDRCEVIDLQRRSLSGWVEARELAPKGGAVELLGPTRRLLEQLEELKAGSLALEVEYAQTAIRAAISAAQDERAEMELLLAHARDLSERLTLRGRRAIWPRPFNLLAGELWFEVDRYEEARAAFERAAKSDGAPVAFVGLGRANARLGDHAAACQAYGSVRDAATVLQEESRSFLAGCP
jgi:tetratricopeptide (TPR) repeat protein